MKAMVKKTLLLPVLAVLASLAACRPLIPVLQPPAGPYFQHLSIKFSLQDAGTRQNGRVIWRFDENFSKFIFFTPLNQVALELDVAGEEAVLVNFANRTYWRGDFSSMLDRLWGIGVSLSALRSLLLAGAAPATEFLEKGITVAIERAVTSGVPAAVRLSRGGAELALRISKREFRPGRIVWVDYAGRYRAAELQDVLAQ